MASPADRASGKPHRIWRWLRFGLPTLLGVVTLSAILLALIVNPIVRQRRAVAAVRGLGGVVYYEGDKPFIDLPPSRIWLRKQFGDDSFANVVAVYLTNTQVNNAGLAHLSGLSRLQVLDLSNTPIEDEGLAHLKGLTGLQVLYLYNTRISDAGLTHLNGLTGLRELYLDNHNIEISREGVDKLRAALPGCEIKRVDVERL